MFARGQFLKLTAVSVLVMLTLTGFSNKTGGTSGKGKSGKSSSSGGGGGGCSSSSQDHDSSSSSGGGSTTGGSTTGSTTSGGTSGGGSTALKDGVAVVLSCAGAKQPYATVEVRNPNVSAAEFEIAVHFRDAEGLELDVSEVTVALSGKETETVEVPVAVSFPSQVDECLLYESDPDAIPID